MADAVRRLGYYLRFLEDLYVKPEQEGWDRLTDDVRNAIIDGVSNFEDAENIAGVMVPLNRRSWNVMSSRARSRLLRVDQSTTVSKEMKGMLAGMAAENVVLRQTMIAETDFVGELIETDPENSEQLVASKKDYVTAVELLEHAHLIFRYASELGPRISRGKKRSADALDMTNISPSAVNIFDNSSLPMNNVHYGMFWGLDSQGFKRFELPCTLDSLFVFANTTMRAKVKDIADKTVKLIQGMPTVLAGKHEPETQVGFQCMLRKVVRDLSKTVLNNKKICVKSINEMDAVRFKQEIREKYWEDYSKEHPDMKPPASRMKIVSVESDLALWEANDKRVLGEARGVKKKEIFLRTRLNIEMKHLGRLDSKKNRSELTQLGLQALARSKGRAECAKQHKSLFEPEEEVYSILTDCTTLYVLRHDVKNGTYWMSRGIEKADDQASALCWLVLATHGQPGIVSSFDEAWECPESQNHEDTKGDEEATESLAVQVEPDGSYYDKDGVYHDSIHTRLPNGRSIEKQRLCDKKAYRFSNFIGYYDTAALLGPSFNSVRQQTTSHQEDGSQMPQQNTSPQEDESQMRQQSTSPQEDESDTPQQNTSPQEDESEMRQQNTSS